MAIDPKCASLRLTKSTVSSLVVIWFEIKCDNNRESSVPNAAFQYAKRGARKSKSNTFNPKSYYVLLEQFYVAEFEQTCWDLQRKYNSIKSKKKKRQKEEGKTIASARGTDPRKWNNKSLELTFWFIFTLDKFSFVRKDGTNAYLALTHGYGNTWTLPDQPDDLK